MRREFSRMLGVCFRLLLTKQLRRMIICNCRKINWSKRFPVSMTCYHKSFYDEHIDASNNKCHKTQPISFAPGQQRSWHQWEWKGQLLLCLWRHFSKGSVARRYRAWNEEEKKGHELDTKARNEKRALDAKVGNWEMVLLWCRNFSEWIMDS